MTAEQLKTGHFYEVKQASGGAVPVMLVSIEKHQHRTRYNCKNLKTGRMLSVKSAQRFRCEYAPGA